ncbi:MAG: PorT family protein [Candidatus Krumholzibacteria bacterium]|nr:PorT family protein [Candidatus Krumholzibacteria bacterium]
MKTLSIFLILVLTLAFAVAANAEGTVFGIKAGVNFANISGDDTDDLNSLTGFAGGGFVDIAMSPTISIQPEIFYSQKGAKFNEEGTEISVKLDYIDVPVLFKYTMAGENARPYFLFGPSIGFSINSELSADDQSVELDNVASTDFGLVFGFGVNFQKFLIEGRYGLGLSDIIDENTPEDDGSINNTTFQIMAGYSF